MNSKEYVPHCRTLKRNISLSLKQIQICLEWVSPEDFLYRRRRTVKFQRSASDPSAKKFLSFLNPVCPRETDAQKIQILKDINSCSDTRQRFTILPNCFKVTFTIEENWFSGEELSQDIVLLHERLQFTLKISLHVFRLIHSWLKWCKLWQVSSRTVFCFPHELAFDVDYVP